MLESLQSLSQQIGMDLGLFIFIIIWTVFWKLLGLWYSARKNQPIWFIVIAIFNTIGILPILYLFVFKDLKKKKSSKEILKQKKSTKKKTSKKNSSKISKSKNKPKKKK